MTKEKMVARLQELGEEYKKLFEQKQTIEVAMTQLQGAHAELQRMVKEEYPDEPGVGPEAGTLPPSGT